MKNQITFNQIIEHCELTPKAIIVNNELNFFLKTNEDRAKFIQEFENRQLFRNNNGLAIMKLAREIGAYHYDTVTLDEMERLDCQEALERLFIEPVNAGKMSRVMEHAVKAGETFSEGLKRLYEHKIHNPEHTIMRSLRYL